ncbi:MAG: hypothetical protein KC445_04270 [Anaerolineales bacterium]|nr:hypothetical protein [Anaerolineales bacterium]
MYKYAITQIFNLSLLANCINFVGTFIDNGDNLSVEGPCANGGTGSATNATLNLSVLERIPAEWQTLTEQDIVCESAGNSAFAFTSR